MTEHWHAHQLGVSLESPHRSHSSTQLKSTQKGFVQFGSLILVSAQLTVAQGLTSPQVISIQYRTCHLTQFSSCHLTQLTSTQLCRGALETAGVIGHSDISEGGQTHWSSAWGGLEVALDRGIGRVNIVSGALTEPWARLRRLSERTGGQR